MDSHSVKPNSSRSKKGRDNNGKFHNMNRNKRVISSKLIIRNLHQNFTLPWFQGQIGKLGYILDEDVTILYQLEGGLFVAIEESKIMDDFMLRLSKLSSVPKSLETTSSTTADADGDDSVKQLKQQKNKDNEMLYVVEHAPFQQIATTGASQKTRRGDKTSSSNSSSSIENDSYYKKFVQSQEIEEKLPSAEIAHMSKLDALQVLKTAAMAKGLDSFEAEQVAKDKIEPKKISPLVQYLNSLSSSSSSSSRSGRSKYPSSGSSSSSSSSSSRSRSGKGEKNSSSSRSSSSRSGSSSSGSTRRHTGSSSSSSGSSSSNSSIKRSTNKQALNPGNMKHTKILLKKKDGTDPVGVAIHAATTAMASMSVGDNSSSRSANSNSNSNANSSSAPTKTNDRHKNRRTRSRKKKSDTKGSDGQKKNDGN